MVRVKEGTASTALRDAATAGTEFELHMHLQCTVLQLWQASIAIEALLVDDQRPSLNAGVLAEKNRFESEVGEVERMPSLTAWHIQSGSKTGGTSAFQWLPT